MRTLITGCNIISRSHSPLAHSPICARASVISNRLKHSTPNMRVSLSHGGVETFKSRSVTKMSSCGSPSIFSALTKVVSRRVLRSIIAPYSATTSPLSSEPPLTQKVPGGRDSRKPSKSLIRESARNACLCGSAIFGQDSGISSPVSALKMSIAGLPSPAGSTYWRDQGSFVTSDAPTSRFNGILAMGGLL